MEYKAAGIELKDSAVDIKARTFEGYAATWDLDLVGDVIKKGAFQKSIKENFPAGNIKVLWQHDKPIGVPEEITEDSKGLYVRARVSDTQLGNEALELMKDRAVDQMSIGFTIPARKSQMNDDGQREIHEIKLMEFSPVTFPANENAVITGVKSLAEQLLLAKNNGIQINDSAELLKLLTELKALIKTDEPLIDTRQEIQPLVKESISALNELSNFAKLIRG